MAKLSRLRRLATASAAGALLMSTVPATFAPASASHTYVRDLESGCPSDRVPDRNFSDVDDGATHEFTINCLVWYEITVGTSDTTYSPGVNTKRGQMAAFLYRLLDQVGVALNDNAPTAFEDVEGTLFEDEINALAEIGVVFGEEDTDDYDGDGNTNELIYKPNTEMDRGLMAAFINNVHEAATGAPMTSSNDYFTDDNDSPFEDDINALAENGVVTGKTENTYEPDGFVQRGAMGSFISRQADNLVDAGVLRTPVNGAMDIILDVMDIQQGRALEGLVYMDESDSVASMTVDGCSINNETVPVDGDDRFTVTIPLEQPATQCQLVFDVTLTDGQQESETKSITVTETDKYLAGPTPVTSEVVSSNSENVTIRFEFDEAINTTAVQPGSFALHEFDGSTSAGGTSASIVSDNIVDVTWTADQFQDATTVVLSPFAVQDLDGNPNAPFALGVQELVLDAGETNQPDLESVTGSGFVWTFNFDQIVYNTLNDESNDDIGGGDESTQADQFHLILADGSDIAGTGAVESPSTTSRRITFSYEGSTPVGAYIEAGAVDDQEGQVGPGDNPRQYVTLSGQQGARPFLTNATIDAASNSVQVTFNENVSFRECAEFPSPDYNPMCSESEVVLFDIFGVEYTSSSVASGPNNNQVTATFAAETPWELVAGGSVDQGLVQAAGDGKQNAVGGFGTSNTFAEGETAAPDLIGVTRATSTDEGGNITEIRFTLKFDQAFDHVTAGGNTNVLLYTFEQSTRNIEGNCSVDDELFELVCSVTGEDNIAFAAQAVYVAITGGSVNEDGSTATRPNHSAGFQVG